MPSLPRPRAPTVRPARPAVAAAGLVALLAWPGGAQAQASAAAPVPVQTPRARSVADAVAACERAARQSLAPQGAPAAELKFVSAPAEAQSADGPMVLHGSGSWRGGGTLRRFEYSCSVDLRTPDTVGLLLRDTTPAAAAARPASSAIEPDLSHLSPAACEAGAAVALKKRWPRVAEISFDSGTRTLTQESPARAELRGQGRALTAPGSPYVHFEFSCELDPRDGRVLGTRISG